MQKLIQPTGLFWLSFADDSGFLGACLVRADDFIGAVTRSHQLGINPGGECRGLGPLPPDSKPDGLPMDRLLMKDQIPGATKWPDDDDETEEAEQCKS